MQRRELLLGLSTGAACAIAGCLGGGCVSGTGVRFEPVDADAVAAGEATADLDDTPAMMADLVGRTVDGETPVVETRGRSPIDWLSYVDRDGQFYEVTAETIAEGAVSGPAYELSRDRDASDEVDPDDTRSFEELPEHDRWLVNEGADYAIEVVEEMSFSTSIVAGFLDEADRDASELAAGVDESYLDVHGSYVQLERSGDGTTTAKRIRHEASRIAESVDEFADHVLARRGADLSDPAPAVRSLLEEVEANGGHVDVCGHEMDDEDEAAADRRAAVEELQSTLEELEPGSAGDGGNETTGSGSPNSDAHPRDRPGYVRYDGEWYRISLSEFAA